MRVSVFFIAGTCASLATLACGTEKNGNNTGLNPDKSIVVEPRRDKDLAVASPSPSAYRDQVKTNEDPLLGEPQAGPNSNPSPQPEAEPPAGGSPTNEPSPGASPVPVPQVPEPIATEPVTVAPTKVIVTVKGLDNQNGVVCYTLFDRAKGFPDGSNGSVSAGCFEIPRLPLVFTLENLPQGTYAMALWHDENRDGTMNKNFFGIPKEGLAFSRDGKPRMTPPPGPPPFEDVAFAVAAGQTQVSSEMIYLLR